MAENPEQSFEQTALPHLDSVYRAAVALCGRRDEAEDLAQATFLKALERFGTFESGTNCRAWLLQILRNLWIDRLRHAKVAGTTMGLDEALVAAEAPVDEMEWSAGQEPSAGSGKALLEHFSDEQVIRALKELPEDQRLTLFLIDVEQLSQEETAEIMGVAVGTVKSRTSRARSRLKTRLISHARDMGFMGRNR